MTEREQIPTPAARLSDQLEQYLAVPGIAVIREEIAPHQGGYSASHRLIALDHSLDGEEATRALCRETTAFVADFLLPDLSLAEAQIVADGAAQLILGHCGIIEEPEYRQWAHDAASPHLGQIHRVAHRILSGIAAQEERP